MRKKSIFFLVAFLALTLIVALLILKSTTSAPRFSVGESSEEHEILFPVARVIDGDTIDVVIDGKTERIRFIGIDTPETVDDRKKIQCYGPEASARMKELLSAKSVALEMKPDEDRDDYGRLLRYVSFQGNDVGAMMLEEGYARSLCFAFPHPRCGEYEKLEREAREMKRGRWGACR